MKIITNIFILIVVLFLKSLVADAHQLSTAYLNADLNDKGLITGQLQIRLYDLEQAIGLDRNIDHKLSWGEVLSRQAAIQQWLKRALNISRSNQICVTNHIGKLQIDAHFNENYLVIPLTFQCGNKGKVDIEYEGLFKFDSEHKLLINLSTKEHSFSRVISNKQNRTVLDIVSGNRLETFKEFMLEGITHIWIGIDHILFVLCLLFAAVIYGEKNLKGKIKTQKLILSVLKIITAFTLAHSLTLSVTALNWLHISSRWVEVSIALTVLLTAINNIMPIMTRFISITFAFGLLHGMGFASVLRELGLDNKHQILSILAFNVGVELGQIVLILLMLPLLIILKNKAKFANQLLKASSGLIAIIACFWIFERLQY